MFAPRDDWDAQAALFAVDNRIRLEGVLPQSLAEEYHQLIANIPYALMVTVNGMGQALAPKDLAAMPPEDRAQLQEHIYAEASKGIGFVYEGHQLPKSSNPALRAIIERINAPDTIDRIRKLTGIEDITHADGQATRYRPGHFLTRHLDDPQGEQRRLAFVIGLTRNWHPDWGGLLQFFEKDGTPRDSWCPAFNTLSMFDVRHVHSVTFVTPFAAEPRLSITGWFRAGEPL